ncbi:MAG: TraR/DksA C4-type zinc finger protein [Actinomycetota bacterium]|nr:TraR/DksA C4-type zinc finger protein [Actinomycetota bacterium]
MRPTVPSAAGGLRRELQAAHRRSADLATELGALEDATAEKPDDEHDPDGSTIGYERARVGALLARAQVGIDDLAAALARLETGTYGHCQDCARPIGAERLAALPSTTTCVVCAGVRSAQGRARANTLTVAIGSSPEAARRS